MHEVAVHDALARASLILSVGVPVIDGPLVSDCIVALQPASSTEAIDTAISTRIERIDVI